MATNQTAPGRLELLRGFVNTRDVEQATDALATPEQAASWLGANGLPGGRDPLSAADRERLVAVREALRELLLANNANEVFPGDALTVLNEQSVEAALGLRFDRAGAELVSACGGIDSSIAALLAIVHESMHDGSWQRLKACPAEDCLWAFYDRSRNRSGTWCRMEECGNRAKARAYRERHRPEPEGVH